MLLSGLTQSLPEAFFVSNVLPEPFLKINLLLMHSFFTSHIPTSFQTWQRFEWTFGCCDLTKWYRAKCHLGSSHAMLWFSWLVITVIVSNFLGLCSKGSTYQICSYYTCKSCMIWHKHVSDRKWRWWFCLVIAACISHQKNPLPLLQLEVTCVSMISKLHCGTCSLLIRAYKYSI